VLDKLGRKLHYLATLSSKGDNHYQLNMEYHQAFQLFDELKHETQKSIEAIRQSLHYRRPMIVTRDQLKERIKRTELANEIISDLESSIRTTFDRYASFIHRYWTKGTGVGTADEQRISVDKYEIVMIDWQDVLAKIQRFNDETKALS
jgi:hypothetical protein